MSRMIKMIAIAAGIAAALFPATVRGFDGALPSGAEVIAAHLEATGGAARDRVHVRRMTGRVAFSNPEAGGTFTVWQARPDKRRWLFEGDEGPREQGCDGTVAWQLLGNTPRIKQNEERAVALRAARFDGLGDWREVYTTARCIGIDTVGHARCLVVELQPAVGQPERLYFDKDSHLLVKRSVSVQTTAGTLEADIFLGDYRTVDGIRIPHTMRQKTGAREMLMTVDTVEHDLPVPTGQFEPPAPIRALMSATPAPCKSRT